VAEVEPVVAEVEPVVAEVEPVVAEVEPVVAEVEPDPEPVVAEVEPEPEPVVAEVEPEPEPVVAEVEPEPEPVPARLRIPPIRDTILPFPTRRAPAPAEDEQPAAAAEANSPELAARRAQLDDLGLGGPDSGLAEGEVPQPLPYRSRGAAGTQADLARAEVMRRSFWEASAREVASAGAQVGVQSCGQCGLSLSASARFCRRCGTPQAQSA
jgi:ribosomal protein L40E